jgi:signal transduction histidine kinase
MSNHRRTLSKKLSIRILLLAIPLFALSLGVFYRHAKVLLYKEATERSVTTLNTTVKLVENYLTAIETAAKSNAWMLEDEFVPDSIEKMAHRIVRLNGNVLSCSVSTEPDVFPDQGKYFSVYSVNEGDTIITIRESEFEYFEKNWYKKPFQTGRPCWINPFSDFNEGSINHHDAVGSYCIPLRPKGGKIAGVVSVDFSFQRLRETILATHHPYPSSYYMVLGPNGGYLIHPQSNLLYKKSIFSATDSVEHPDVIALGRDMTAGKTGTTHVKFDDEECHVCYTPLKDTGWSIALVCYEKDVLEDYNHLAIIMIVIVMVGMLLILWITRRVVQRNIGPLNELMEATKKISESNYDTVLPESKHKDIVSKLQNAFRKMQLAIMSHTEAIKRNEEEIKKETAELEKALPLAKEVSRRKQTFIQNVSRQINNPLNIINGLVHVLQSTLAARGSAVSAHEVCQSEEMRQITSTMKYNATLLYRMTLMLYDSSETGQASVSQFQRNDVVACNEVVRNSINHIQILYPSHRIRFVTEVPDSLSIRTHARYLLLTLSELLQNAVKFSDGQHISLLVTQTDDAVRFIVEDVGPGLSKVSEELVYVPFTKVDDLSEGLGLGLPLCKSHMSFLNGKLIYDKNYHEGCRFIVELPKD